ncbi:MAG: peptidoglycan-binding protein, partial [Oscillospiraceae bacterium]|nr:peptidoglycan-binding protein [Oscillospiraceae bacterium]
RAAQLLLNGRYCSCGMWGADGEFGPQTKSAVLAYQRRSGLEADGIIGPQTWAKLLGVTM